ncbi:MAG: hypothetical protein AVDCRST_MAG78-3670 [uncultured Rubrobacteraceae bacterium]|uniref:Acyl-CoA dehydrogenase/oxidase N-terminal domain-containing protein n=1 Tax=uncultured Rubrobacteraceae bacterium TaxID=349277 RepID=A0A6J4QS61_9ACTN|nr:MAG: hypothetical protein AVDCRST_MAG78-3670 [uncultured Rubrobacteraceae bacterium]
MNFELSHAQQEIKDRAAEFADRVMRYPAKVFEKLPGADFVGPWTPEEYGGVVRDFSLTCCRSRGDQPCRCRRGGCDCGARERGHAPTFTYGNEE